ncbi:MAG: hypothetical protein JHC85_09445 [Chthoniobacterales bacterium]|nr:hypothetical protein [Chthoniobacterales bacterium]
MKIKSMIGRLVVGITLLMTAGMSAHARKIGGYVDKAEDRFVRNVWNFIREYSSNQNVGGQLWKYSHYYYMQPYMFTTSNDSWTDAMDFVYAAGHGNSYLLQCNKAAGVSFDFSADMPTTNGLGDSNAEYLVIESCLTVQSLAETSDPWTPWMRTLKGLHQIVGFHTLSYSDNGIPNNYARKLKAGLSVWQAWFQAVNEERSVLHGSFYPGMASAIFYAGTRNDTLATAGYPDPSGWGGWRGGRDWGSIWNWYQRE